MMTRRVFQKNNAGLNIFETTSKTVGMFLTLSARYLFSLDLGNAVILLLLDQRKVHAEKGRK
jgi:hypothetical protein